MRQDRLPSSFQKLEAGDIDHAKQVEVLNSVSVTTPNRTGWETWSCVWAPDGSYFAWSCGARKVQLVPWDQVKNFVPDKSKCYNTQARFQLVPDLLHGLPQNDEPTQLKLINCHRQHHIIDCGEMVWSLAFGSGKSQAVFSTKWHRFHFDRNLILATGLQSGRIKLWACETGALLMELLDHKDVVRSLSFSPDGSLILVSGSRDGTLKLWDLNDDGNMTKTLRGDAGWIFDCQWSPNCKFLASVGNKKSVILWNMEVHKPERKFDGHYHDVTGCDFSPDGALLATASYDTRVIIWDIYTGDAVKELGHLFPPPRPIFAGGANDHYVRGVCFSPHGLGVTSISDDGYVRFWHFGEDRDPESIAVHRNAVCCNYSPLGAVVAVGDRSGSVVFYAAPQRVESLQHIARMSIRRILPSTKVDYLHLPLRLKEFIKYRYIE
ncbi:hypothetical protein ScPMuIL_006448 [Solemya velum]